MALEKKYYSGSQVFDIIKELPNKEFLSMLNTFAKERRADVVERKKGKWLVIEDELWDGGGRYECSVCGCGFAFGAFHEMNEQHYCPNCGTRMERSEE